MKFVWIIYLLFNVSNILYMSVFYDILFLPWLVFCLVLIICFGWYGDAWLLVSCVKTINETKSPAVRKQISYLAPISMIVISIIIAMIVFITSFDEIIQNESISLQEQINTSDDATVLIVKSGSFNQCPSFSVEQVVNSFMSSPIWKAILADDGQNYVNIIGDITYFDKDVSVLIQYLVDEKNDIFEFNAIELNGVPSSDVIAAMLIKSMCDSVTNEQHQIKDDVNTSKKTVDIYRIGDTVSAGLFKIYINMVETTGRISDSLDQLESLYDSLLFMDNPDAYVFGPTGVIAQQNREKRDERTKAMEGNIYVVITYTIENISKEPISFFSLPELTLLNNEEYEFAIDDDATYRLQDFDDLSDEWSDLNPLTPTTKVAVFSVPKNKYFSGEWYLQFESGSWFNSQVNISFLLSPNGGSEPADNAPEASVEIKTNPSHEQGHILARSKKHGLEVIASEEDGVWCDEEVQLYFNAANNDFFSNNVFNMTKTIGSKVLPNECPVANTIKIQGFVSGSDVIVFDGVASKQDAWLMTQ